MAGSESGLQDGAGAEGHRGISGGDRAAKKYDIRYSIDAAAERGKCEPLCVCCYHSLLEDIFGLEAWRLARQETVGELSRRRNDEKLIIRVDGHLTCSIFGEVLDIWDCSDEIVDCYWVV